MLQERNQVGVVVVVFLNIVRFDGTLTHGVHVVEQLEGFASFLLEIA